MAHTKAGGSTQNVRDSQPKYLGIKLHNGETARIGNVLVRQRGTRYLAGNGVRIGHDHTLYAVKDGVVKFGERRKLNFNGTHTVRKVVNVV